MNYPRSKRIILNAFGSMGDIHPFVAIGVGLRERGHNPVIATHASSRQKVEAEGLEFVAIRPDFTDLGDPAETVSRAMDSRRGPEHVVRMMMNHLRDSYDDLVDAAQGADLLVTHPIGFAAPIVAEKLGIAWASVVLAPLCFFSQYDPPIVPGYPDLREIYKRSRVMRPVLRWVSRHVAGPWFRELYALRNDLGLPPAGIPILQGQHSPYLVLAAFSEVLGAPQPDWPPHTHQTGFCFYDKHLTDGLSPELEEFLRVGPPPIVFTLGSAACMSPGDFYKESITAAQVLRRRAVLLTGQTAEGNLPEMLGDGIIACDYAPYSDLFPRAAVTVHHGGVGTTGQALRSGRPMLVMPFSQDQPDNAARAVRLGVARTLPARRYSAIRAAAELWELLEDPSYAQRAEEIGRRVRAENGVAAACDAIEDLLSAP